MAVKPIPDGYHAVTPYLIATEGNRLLEFVKKAFGADETVRMDTPDGKVGHAEVRIGDSVVMLADASASESGKPMQAMIHLYVEDADKVYRQAIEAGATSISEPSDQFYGDRTAGVTDPVGNHWYIATHVEDVSPEEMARRMQQAQQTS